MTEQVAEKTVEATAEPEKPLYYRVPWKDKFNQPNLDLLRSGLTEEEDPPMFDELRERLKPLVDPEERVVWHGDCWHWVIEYSRRDLTEEPLAIIIAAPEDLQFAMLMNNDFIATLNLRRMKRMVRDGIDLCRLPYDTRWGVWSLIPGTMMDDLFGLLKAKIRYLTKHQKKP